MSETVDERRRRKFASGTSDQIAGGLGAYSAGVFTTGFVAPVVASLIGLAEASLRELLPLTVASLAGAIALFVIAVRFKGHAKRLDDDASALDADAIGPAKSYVAG